MPRWIRITALATGAVLGSAALAAALGSLAWSRATARTLALLPAAREAAPRVYSPRELEGLPAPVARYFALVLTPGQPIVRRAVIRHEGTFQMALGQAPVPFTSVQHISAGPPGFVWDARVRMAPLLPVRVRDSYLAGAGAMLGKLGALLPVVDQSGTPEMAAGALHRYLAEAVWVPTALLPSQGVQWEAIDDSTARATLRDHAASVSVDFHFGPGGEIRRTTALRYRDVNGVGVPTPFVAENLDYQRRGAMLVPTRGEVSWLLPEGKLTYWKGRITHAEYDPVP